MIECTECDGTGDCDSCGGEGTDCDTCDGTGDCISCGGDGEVEE